MNSHGNHQATVFMPYQEGEKIQIDV
uniref:Uncharacterized protein n=1 Tax=Arundo donax TaxID=35708 RepID=A0A0A9GBJ1_ARUDO